MDFSSHAFIAILLGTILFFVCIFWAYKTWSITHLIMTVLVYFASVAFALFTGLTLKTESVWRKALEEKKKAVDTERFALLMLEGGYAKDPSTDKWVYLPELKDPAFEKKKSLRQLEAEIELELADRGRVWRSCTPSGITGTGLTLRTTPPPPPATAAAPPTEAEASLKNNLKVGDTVFCFREAELTDETSPAFGYKVPAAYMGEFHVAAATDDSVTLESAGPNTTLLAPDWQPEPNSSPTWAIYAAMPTDSNKLFEGFDEEKLKNYIHPPETATESDKLAKMTEEQRKTYEKSYDDLRKQYLHSGQTAIDDKNAKAGEDPDPDDQVWYKVEFLKPHKFEVESAQKAEFTDRYFDDKGGAIPSQLRLSKETEMAIGETLVLKKDEAQPLIDGGTAKLLEKVFIRQLRDYAFLFRQLQMQRVRIYDSDEVMRADLIPIIASAQRVDEEKVYREAEKAKLESDRNHYLAELNVVKGLYQAVEERQTRNRAELFRLYNENNQMAAELARLQAKLSDSIDQRVRGAAPPPTTPPATPPRATTPATPPATPRPAGS